MDIISSLVEESNDLPRNMFPSSLLVIHDPRRCRENNVSELTGGQKLDNPLLEISQAHVVSRRDDASLVQAVSRSA